MNHGYDDIGNAIYTVLDELDITDIYPKDWAQKSNAPLKMLDDGFPAFAIHPGNDEQGGLDSENDDDLFVFSVYIHDSFYESQTAEDRMRQLVDLVRERFRAERSLSRPFDLSNLYNVQISGEWPPDEDHGYRSYRLQLSMRCAQHIETIEDETP